MGCFTIPKHKSKVAAASQLADNQQLQEKNRRHGPKLEFLLSSNKPVLLPDPNYLSGKQPSRPGPISPHTRIRGNQQQEPERGSSVVAALPTTTAGLHVTPSTRLIDHLPRALSAPVSYAIRNEDPSSVPAYSGNPGVPFSGPLSSHLPPTDSSCFAAAPVSPPSANRVGSSLSFVTCVQDINRSSQHPGLDKRVASAFFNEKKAVLYSGRPLRLPKPGTLTSNARPLPLPYPPELDDTTASGATAAVIGGSPFSNPVTSSPNRGTDICGASYSGFRALSMTGSIIGEAMPLPPPALPTQSRIPVRAFRYGELAHSLVPECLICEGVFGRAFRALVEDDGENGSSKIIEVAVICPLVKSFQGLKEWMAEVTWLARLQDSHLCKLVGYCAEDIPGQGNKRFLVYEFLGNGSLDGYKEGNFLLDWSTRMRLALDIAQGLAYLHNKAPFQVISRDLDPCSVQLDKDLRAKLSGFGLARCGPEGDQGPILTGPYVAPESSFNGLVTVKSNAWSFGVMLLELLTGRKHLDPSVSSGQQNLVQLTKPFLRDESKLFLIMDPELNGRYSGRGSLKVASLAFQCLIKEASLRPNLSEAVEILKVVQTDEDLLAFELKKSRSLSQSVGSPVNYGRPTGDVSVQRACGPSSLTSSPSSDAKLRDREFLKSPYLGSGTPSPSYFESRLSNDPKYCKSGLSDQDMPSSTTLVQQPFESRLQHLQVNQQDDRDSQKATTAQSVDSSVQIASSHLSESKQRGLRKGTLNGHMSFFHSMNDRKATNPIQQIQGTESRRLQPSIVSGPSIETDIRHSNLQAQKTLVQAHLQGVLARSTEIKPHQQDTQNADLKKFSNLQPSSVLSSGEIKLDSAGSRAMMVSCPQTSDIEEPHLNTSKITPESKIDCKQLCNNLTLQDQRSSTQWHEVTSEVNQKHEQEIQKFSSSRSSGSSWSSCAPALTFEPPVLREDSCVW